MKHKNKNKFFRAIMIILAIIIILLFISYFCFTWQQVQL